MQASNATLRGLVSASPVTPCNTSISCPEPVESIVPAVTPSVVLLTLVNPIADGFVVDASIVVVVPSPNNLVAVVVCGLAVAYPCALPNARLASTPRPSSQPRINSPRRSGRLKVVLPSPTP
jgi:hypothetical protein